MSLRENLLETFAYMPPRQVLDGLPAEDATRRVAGTPHSILEICAHLNFWQDWFLKRVDGVAEPVVTSAAAGWPSVAGRTWEPERDAFFAGLERAVAISEDAGRLTARVEPAIEFPPLAHFTVRDALMHVALHNAHHLGQIVTLRQIMGLWPPPDGAFTW